MMNFHVLFKYLKSLLRYHAIAFFASFVLVAAPLSAASNEPAVYAGTVGSARVVMELEGEGDNADHDVTARYFYRKYRLDIGLNGTRTGDRLILESRSNGDRMTLRRTSTGLSGLLTTKDARRVPVNLSPLTADAVSSSGFQAGLPGLSRYQRQQLADLALVPADVRQDGARTLRDWREPVSGIVLFRIESGYPAPVLDQINAALERQQWERVSQWFTCEGYGGEPGMDISTASAPYLNDDFVSYAWFASWSCAGTAHPDFGTQGFTFDARTGHELALEDLLHFGVQPAPKADSSAFYAYRSEIFAPRVIALFQQLYPQEMEPAEGDAAQDACDYADPSVWDFPSWYLTREGLYLGAYFSRAQRPCDEPDWSVIPWQHLTWRKPQASAASPPDPRADVLRFGQLAFNRDDIARLSRAFDDGGIPVLDIALRADAAKRLKAETIRLLNTDITIALGDRTLTVARLVEPISEGQFRISGWFGLAETEGMAGQIICAMDLSADQIDPPSLSGRLPCKLNKRQSATQ